MSEINFIGREAELELIEKLWKSSKATFFILYGRRRVGKTRLLTHWLKRHDTNILYWMAEPASALDQLRSFSQALVNFADPETPASSDFTYDSWEHALRQVALLAKEKRIAILIDEVTYIIDVNPAIVGTLQKAWDHWLSKSNLMLALCGSQMGLMQRHLLQYDAPLYGRATAQIKLSPLPFGVTSQYFPQYTPEERVQLYSMWGGIPAYWERLDAQRPVLENLRDQLQPANTWMLDESRLLLQDFITDPYNYVGIMRAIADGRQSLNDISQRIGLPGGPTSKYLSVLRDTGFVVRRIPITEKKPNSRQGRYFVTDPYLRFYYRFLALFQSQLALGKYKQTMQAIEDDLPKFIESNTWQELCSEWLLRASENGSIPVPVASVGSEWRRTFDVDVVGVHEERKSLVLGSCYWGTPPSVEKILANLMKRSSALAPDKAEWSIYYLAFASVGWGDKAREQAEKVILKYQESHTEKNWRPVGVKLLGLAEIDTDLACWTIMPN